MPVAVTTALLTWRGMALAESFVTDNVERTAEFYAAGLDLFVERQRGRLRDLDVGAATLAAEDTQAAAAKAGIGAGTADSVLSAIRAIASNDPGARILICGSLYLAGGVLRENG